MPASLAPDLAAERDEVVVGDGLGADEALLEVGVDDAGGLRRLGAARDGPGARLLGPDREVGDEAEQLVALADQPVEAGLLQAQVVQEVVALLRREHGELGLDLGGDDDAAGAFGAALLLDAPATWRCRRRPRPRRRCTRRATGLAVRAAAR